MKPLTDYEQAQGRLYRSPANPLTGTPVKVNFVSNGIQSMTPLRFAAIIHDITHDVTAESGPQAAITYGPFQPASPDGQRLISVAEKILERFDVTNRPPKGCQRCGSPRPFYCGPREPTLGVLEICLDCGQLQGEWPYPIEGD